MDKKIESIGYSLNEQVNYGTVKIADDVVAMIAALAASEVTGVHSLAGNELLAMVQKNNLTKGVKVSIADKVVEAEVSIVIEYGYNIPEISSQVQTKVKQAIETMTGMEVSDVNIKVAGVLVNGK